MQGAAAEMSHENVCNAYINNLQAQQLYHAR